MCNNYGEKLVYSVQQPNVSRYCLKTIYNLKVEKHGSVETPDFLIVRPRQEKRVALITSKALVSGGALS